MGYLVKSSLVARRSVPLGDELEGTQRHAVACASAFNDLAGHVGYVGCGLAELQREDLAIPPLLAEIEDFAQYPPLGARGRGFVFCE